MPSFAARPGVLALVLAALAAPPASADAGVQRTHGPDRAPVNAPAAAASVASTERWCANATAASARDERGEYRYRSLYAHPADAPNRLAAVGARLQEAAFGASEVIERLYGRAIRFDVGTPCGAGQLDITAVRLPFTARELEALGAAGGTTTFDAVARALRAAGFGVASPDEGIEQLAARRENYLVWLDGPAPPRSCGQGTALLDTTRADTNLNNFGGKLALVFRYNGNFCGADAVRHEIGHNLGALQPDAPNTTDGVHCTDAFEDTMCALEAPKIADGAFNGRYFDYGNDDYWDPPGGEPLPWWTLNLSRFICDDADCNRPAAGRLTTGREESRQAGLRRMERRRAQRPRLARRATRGARYTKLRVRARGAGSARLVIRCRKPVRARGPHRRRVFERRISLPASVRVRTRCRAPRARLSQWRMPRGARL